MTPLEMVKIILEIENKGLHIDDIAGKIIESGMAAGVDRSDLTKKINASLASSVKRKDSIFTRVTNPKDRSKYLKGQYRLKRVTIKPAPLPIPEPEQTGQTGFIGRGGEYAVMSELLFLGLNVSLMSVDQGIDVVAATDQGKYFHIQVKTSKGKDGVFQSSIKRKSFEGANSGQTFYVFVLRRDQKNEFIIIPSSQIAIYIGAGVIKGQDSLSLRFTYDTKARRVTLNGAQDVTLFLNKWAMIR